METKTLGECLGGGGDCIYIKVQARAGVGVGVGVGGTEVVGSELALLWVVETVVLLGIVEEVLTVGQSLAVGCLVVSRMGNLENGSGMRLPGWYIRNLKFLCPIP